MVKTGNVIPAVEKQNPSQSSLLPGRSKSVKRWPVRCYKRLGTSVVGVRKQNSNQENSLDLSALLGHYSA